MLVAFEARCRTCSRSLESTVDQGEIDEAEADDIELVVSDVDATEAFEPSEEPLNAVATAVAPAVVGPGPGSAGTGRDDRLVAELTGHAAGLVDLVGAVGQQCWLAK